MRFFIYKLQDANGNQVDYMTGEKKLGTLADKHETVLMYLEKRGFTPIGGVAVKDDTPTGDYKCAQCGGDTEFREGTNPAGKKWKAYFCTVEKEHKPKWL